MDLLLPFPPSVNHYWKSAIRKGRAGRGLFICVTLSPKATVFRKEALIMVKQQVPQHKTIDYPVRVTAWLHPPRNFKYDVDNFSKGILDALTHAQVWEDDELVHDLRCIKKPKTKFGSVVVTIKPLV